MIAKPHLPRIFTSPPRPSQGAVTPITDPFPPKAYISTQHFSKAWWGVVDLELSPKLSA